jgi:hypothetical protein
MSALFLSFNMSFGLCIACGCDGNYQGCAQTTFYDDLTESEYNAQMRYCKSVRKMCHGKGIGIGENR